MFLDGIVLKRSWAGEVRNVSVLVPIAVNNDGYREEISVTEEAKEDKTGWSAFLKPLTCPRKLDHLQVESFVHL